jgi:hypothetical protein
MFEKLAAPDVLVYWVPSEGFSGGALPVNAHLLGPLSNRAVLDLPEKPGRIGRFALYSLANQEIVAVSKTVNMPPRP